jgi:hypothetical protein
MDQSLQRGFGTAHHRKYPEHGDARIAPDRNGPQRAAAGWLQGRIGTLDTRHELPNVQQQSAATAPAGTDLI